MYDWPVTGVVSVGAADDEAALGAAETVVLASLGT